LENLAPKNKKTICNEINVKGSNYYEKERLKCSELKKNIIKT
jgi:hypothetical protein